MFGWQGKKLNVDKQDSIRTDRAQFENTFTNTVELPIWMKNHENNRSYIFITKIAGWKKAKIIDQWQHITNRSRMDKKRNFNWMEEWRIFVYRMWRVIIERKIKYTYIQIFEKRRQQEPNDRNEWEKRHTNEVKNHIYLQRNRDKMCNTRTRIYISLTIVWTDTNEWEEIS